MRGRTKRLWKVTKPSWIYICVARPPIPMLTLHSIMALQWLRQKPGGRQKTLICPLARNQANSKCVDWYDTDVYTCSHNTHNDIWWNWEHCPCQSSSWSCNKKCWPTLTCKLLQPKRRDDDTNGLQRKDQSTDGNKETQRSIQLETENHRASQLKPIQSNARWRRNSHDLGITTYVSSSWAGLAPRKHRWPSWVHTPSSFGWSGARPARLGCVILHQTIEELHKRLQIDDKIPSIIIIIITIIFKVPFENLSTYLDHSKRGGGGCFLEPLQVCYLRVSILRLLATLQPPKGVHNTRLHGYDWERHVCNLGSRAAYTPTLLKLWNLVPTSLQSLRSFSIVPTHPFIQCIIIMIEHCAYLPLLLL